LRHAGYNYARLMFFAPPLSAGGWWLIQCFSSFQKIGAYCASPAPPMDTQRFRAERYLHGPALVLIEAGVEETEETEPLLRLP
jgi:hypothetical protein